MLYIEDRNSDTKLIKGEVFVSINQLKALSGEEKKFFDANGYLLVRGVLNKEEVEDIKDHFTKLHAKGEIPGCFKAATPEEAGGDILKQYPRMMHPHKVDEKAKNYMLHSEVMNVLHDIFEEEALAAQSMFYFKPPGARGQALHQDNFFLKVEPGTCVAAWMAIDDADEENGGLVIVPETNDAELQCAKPSGRKDIFAYAMEVEVPEGAQPMPVNMKAGDVLFFNGNLIHGSYPNESKDRFRRALIGHYCGSSTLKIGNHYRPLYMADGTVVDRELNQDAGPCGGEFIEMGAH